MTHRPGDLLRAARERNGLKQKELAALVGTSQAQVSSIERGVTSPSVATLARLLAAMGEHLLLDAEPAQVNIPASRLRADYEQTTPAERVVRAAELSRTLTTIAARSSKA